MSHKCHWPIESMRLQLRRLAPSDEYLYVALYTDEQTMRFIGPPLTQSQAQRSFRAALRSSDPLHRGPLFITIIERASQLSLGLCAIQQLANDSAETGVIIQAAARNRGIATESLRAVIEWALARLPLESIWVRITEHNHGAARLVRAAGLRRSLSADHVQELAPGEAIWTADRNSWPDDPEQFQPPPQEKTDERSRVS